MTKKEIIYADEPMLCDEWTGQLPEGDWVESVKEDGVHCRIRRINGVLKAISRTGIEYHSCQHILDELEGIGVDSLDGELIIPNKPQKYISGKARQHGPCTSLELRVFHGTLPETTQHVWRISNHPVDRNDIDSFYNRAVEFGKEGVVYKKVGYEYTSGKRHGLWLKRKPIRTMDLEVVRLEEGKGRNKGRLGAIVIKRANGVEFNVGTGLTDEQRNHWWAHKDELIGSIIEVAYMEELESGKLRQPVFKGIREDKENGE